MGGLSINSTPSAVAQSHMLTHKIFLFSNYLLLAAASSCIFLTLSLRLIPSLSGSLLILLQILTIIGAISGCTAVSSDGSNRWYAAHMVSTVLTAIFQGSVSVLVFTTTSDFLRQLKSYVKEDDGVVILKMVGGLCIAVFCLEWVALGLAFKMRYYAFVEGNGGNGTYYRNNAAKFQDDDGTMKPMPFQPFQV